MSCVKPPKPEVHEWIIRVYLGDVTDAAAQIWMDVIDEAIMTHDADFSGLVAMRKEPVS